MISVPTVLAYAAQYGLDEPTNLDLRPTTAGLWYVVRQGARVLRMDARTGALAPVERAEAEATARRDQAGAPTVASAELITEAPIEYREKRCGRGAFSSPTKARLPCTSTRRRAT